MAAKLRTAEVELQFSRNDLQGRRVVSQRSVLRRLVKDRQLLSVVVSNPSTYPPINSPFIRLVMISDDN